MFKRTEHVAPTNDSVDSPRPEPADDPLSPSSMEAMATQPKTPPPNQTLQAQKVGPIEGNDTKTHKQLFGSEDDDSRTPFQPLDSFNHPTLDIGLSPRLPIDEVVDGEGATAFAGGVEMERATDIAPLTNLTQFTHDSMAEGSFGESFEQDQVRVRATSTPKPATRPRPKPGTQHNPPPTLPHPSHRPSLQTTPIGTTSQTMDNPLKHLTSSTSAFSPSPCPKVHTPS